MTFEELKSQISSLIGENATNEQLKALGVVLNGVDELKTKEDELVKSSNELRKDYIDLVKSSSFKGKLEEEKPEKEITLEDCLREEMKKSK